jgi:hypothetical protein
MVLRDWHIGYTWLGDRAKWTQADFGVVHLCDPVARAAVFARDGRVVALPPWRRWLWRHRWSRPIARRLRSPGLTARLIIRPVEEETR